MFFIYQALYVTIQLHCSPHGVLQQNLCSYIQQLVSALHSAPPLEILSSQELFIQHLYGFLQSQVLLLQLHVQQYQQCVAIHQIGYVQQYALDSYLLASETTNFTSGLNKNYLIAVLVYVLPVESKIISSTRPGP